MYTGIVQAACKAVEVARKPDFMSFAVAFPPELLDELASGSSVNIDGVCQTVVRMDEGALGLLEQHVTARHVPMRILLGGGPQYVPRAHIGPSRVQWDDHRL